MPKNSIYKNELKGKYVFHKAYVTIQVDNNAEIWINGEKKGEGSWSGNLGEADINSSPGMADIYIDGKKVGQTPQLISDLIVGRHSITLEKKGYQSETRYIDIKEDDILNVRISLSEEKTSQNKTKKSDKSTNKAQGYFIPNL